MSSPNIWKRRRHELEIRSIHWRYSYHNLSNIQLIVYTSTCIYMIVNEVEGDMWDCVQERKSDIGIHTSTCSNMYMCHYWTVHVQMYWDRYEDQIVTGSRSVIWMCLCIPRHIHCSEKPHVHSAMYMYLYTSIQAYFFCNPLYVHVHVCLSDFVIYYPCFPVVILPVCRTYK